MLRRSSFAPQYHATAISPRRRRLSTEVTQSARCCLSGHRRSGSLEAGQSAVSAAAAVADNSPSSDVERVVGDVCGRWLSCIHCRPRRWPRDALSRRPRSLHRLRVHSTQHPTEIRTLQHDTTLRQADQHRATSSLLLLTTCLRPMGALWRISDLAISVGCVAQR